MLAAFETLLKQTMGLDAASIGSSAIERAVQERLSVCHLKDPDAYWERVHSSETELQELIEAVVVPETWFFRDPDAFAALVRLVLEEWLPGHPDGLLRLLSLPCSTGEEPNSMAMALFDAGFPANRFAIDAIDISARALARAQRGLYGKNSFRGKELGFRDRHFEPTAHGHRLAESVRRRIHFQQGNVFAAGFLPGAELYDIILCRNLLIYFDRATQDRVIEVLARLLRTQGFLFVGPSESGLLLSHGFVSAKLPFAFAFRKGAAASPESAPAIAHDVKRPPVARPRASFLVTPKPSHVRPAGQAVASPANPPTVGLDEAERLANQGHLAEAAKHCEAHLREHGPSPEALYLLGLVRDADGSQAQAAETYRKVLYLDPNHHEALVHLALLLAKCGDRAGAQVLQQRARRLQQKSGK